MEYDVNFKPYPMKTFNKVIAMSVVSTFLFASEAKVIEELNIDNMTNLTIDSRQNVSSSDNRKDQDAKQSQHRIDGDDDMPGQSVGAVPTDGDDDMPDQGDVCLQQTMTFQSHTYE